MQCWSIGCCWDSQRSCKISMKRIMEEGCLLSAVVCLAFVSLYIFWTVASSQKLVGFSALIKREWGPEGEELATLKMWGLLLDSIDCRSAPLNRPTGMSFVFKLTSSSEMHSWRGITCPMWSLCTYLQSLESEVHQHVTPCSIAFDALVLLM